MRDKKNNKNGQQSSALCTQPIQSIFDTSLEKFPTLGQDLYGATIKVTEDTKNVYAQLSLPGFNVKDVKVRVEGNQVVISAYKEKQKEEKSKNSYRYEKQSGSFSQAFTATAKLAAKKIRVQQKGDSFTIAIAKR